MLQQFSRCWITPSPPIKELSVTAVFKVLDHSFSPHKRAQCYSSFQGAGSLLPSFNGYTDRRFPRVTLNIFFFFIIVGDNVPQPVKLTTLARLLRFHSLKYCQLCFCRVSFFKILPILLLPRFHLFKILPTVLLPRFHLILFFKIRFFSVGGHDNM